MSSRRGLLWLLAVLAAGLALRLHGYIGPYTTDCFGNAQFAYQVATGTFDIGKEYYAANRIGFLFPMGLTAWALGLRPFAYSLVGLLCSLGCIVLAYVLGARAYDRKTGLIAAAILAVLPLEIFCWSPLLVDSVTPFYWSLSLGLFYLGLVDDPPARHRAWLLFASGFVLGLATYTREHAPIVFLVMAAYLVVRRSRPPRRVLWVLAGFAAMVAIGESYYFAASGVLFLRVRRLWAHFGPGTGAAEGGAIEIGHFQGLKPWFLQSMLTAPDYFGFVFWAAWIAAAVLLVRRDRRDRFVLTWFLALWLVMDFLLRTFVRMLAYPPYINVLDLPGALLCARWLAPHCSASRPARAWGGGLGLVLAVAGVAALALSHTLASSVDTWASSAGSWGRAHAHDVRFETAPILFGSVALAAGLALALRSMPSLKWKPGWGSAVLAALIVSSVFIIGPGVRWRRAEAAPLRDMARIIESDRHPVYFTSLWSATGLNFFLGYHTNFRRYWNRWESVAPPQGTAIEFREIPAASESLADTSYVVLDKGPMRRSQAGHPSVPDVIRIPGYAFTPPTDWRPLFSSDEYALYRVTRASREASVSHTTTSAPAASSPNAASPR